MAHQGWQRYREKQRQKKDLEKREKIIEELREELQRCLEGSVGNPELPYWLARMLGHHGAVIQQAQEVGQRDFMEAGWFMEGGEA